MRAKIDKEETTIGVARCTQSIFLNLVGESKKNIEKVYRCLKFQEKVFYAEFRIRNDFKVSVTGR